MGALCLNNSATLGITQLCWDWTFDKWFSATHVTLSVPFYNGPLPIGQGHGHDASYFMRGFFNSGEVGFGGPWVSAVSALVDIIL